MIRRHLAVAAVALGGLVLAHSGLRAALAIPATLAQAAAPEALP